MWWRSRPARLPTPPGFSPATSCSRSTVRPCATSSATRSKPTSRVVELEVLPRRPRAARGRREARRRRTRPRARERGVRPRAHLRQPLPVLLHLPVAQGHAEEPLPQGRRLPPVVPLRQLHDPDPLHRSRPRAGAHRATRPALREHPRHRPRSAGASAAQSARRHAACGGSRALLDGGIEVHGQIVVCPGINDGDALDDTLLGILDRFPRPRDRRHRAAGRERLHDRARHARRTRAPKQSASSTPSRPGRRGTTRHSVGGSPTPSDEYYLLAGRPFPAPSEYDDFPQHENGIGMARQFEADVPRRARRIRRRGTRHAHGLLRVGRRRAGRGLSRAASDSTSSTRRRMPPEPDRTHPVALVTGQYGARVLAPLADDLAGAAGVPVRLVTVPNRFFGGNIGVTGLLTGADIAAVLEREPSGQRYLVPDVVLSNGRFLDGSTPDALPRPVEFVPTDGASLVAALRPRVSGLVPRARRRGRRPPERREVHAGQPLRRSARRDRRGEAGRHTRPQGAAGRVERSRVHRRRHRRLAGAVVRRRCGAARAVGEQAGRARHRRCRRDPARGRRHRRYHGRRRASGARACSARRSRCSSW